MCQPIYIDPSIQVTRYSGTILPGETPIQAAVRRHHERKSLQESERKSSCSYDESSAALKADEDTTEQQVEAQTPEVSGSEVDENKRRRSSWGDRWRGFRRQYLP